MIEILGVSFFLLVGICGCIYGLNPSDKYTLYKQSDGENDDV